MEEGFKLFDWFFRAVSAFHLYLHSMTIMIKNTYAAHKHLYMYIQEGENFQPIRMPNSLLCTSKDYRTSLCVEAWLLQSNSIFRHLTMLSLKYTRLHIILSMLRFWLFSHLSFILSWFYFLFLLFFPLYFYRSNSFTFTELQWLFSTQKWQQAALIPSEVEIF